MTVPTGRWFLRRKWILLSIGVPVLAALWWAFRPEKLWITEKVHEPAPFDTSGDPQPILTGRFESTTQQTSGRATIYITGHGHCRSISRSNPQPGPKFAYKLAWFGRLIIHANDLITARVPIVWPGITTNVVPTPQDIYPIWAYSPGRERCPSGQESSQTGQGCCSGSVRCNSTAKNESWSTNRTRIYGYRASTAPGRWRY
jgi:hypothetical protein